MLEENYEQYFDQDLMYEETDNGIEVEILEENLSVEGLDLGNLNLVRIDMNIVEYPLFSKNNHRKKNQSVKYFFNNSKDTYIKVLPIAGDHIPGELEEKVFIILLKIMKKKEFPQSFYISSSEIFAELGTQNRGYYDRIKKALMRLSKTNYEFKNTLYSSKLGQNIEQKISTSMLSLEHIKLSKNHKLRNIYSDSRIKEIFKITISDHFYENIIRKGYMVYDTKILLDIDNSISRTLYMLLTKLRFNNLYLKLPSVFLIKRIPLKYEERRIKRTISIIENACKELLEKGLIKDYKVIKNASWKESEVEFTFDEIHNEIKQSHFYTDKNYFTEVISAKSQLLISHTEEISTILEEVKEEIKEKNVSDEEILNIIDNLPAKAKKLKTLPKFLKESVRKYGLKHITLTAEYIKEKKPDAIISYFTKTLANGWADEYIQNKEKAEKVLVEKKKVVNEELEEKIDSEKDKELLEAIKVKYLGLSDTEKQRLENLAYSDYVLIGGGQESAFTKKAFNIGKQGIIAKYLLKNNYFDSKDPIEPEKIEPPKEMIQKEKVIKIEKEYADFMEFKFDAFEQAETKLPMQLIKTIMNFLTIEEYYRGQKEGYKIEFRYSKDGKSLIYLEKLD